MTQLAETNLIRVMCEYCLHSQKNECLICNGAKFYFWDAITQLCFSGDGSPLYLENENGEKIHLKRDQAATSSAKFDIKTMLTYIELWVAETPVRKWKLLLDENGWQACIWFNRYKRTCFETSDVDLEVCITRTYAEILHFQSHT